MKQLGSVHAALARTNLWSRGRKSNVDKEKPVRKKGKKQNKRGSDCLFVVYDPKFFYHHYRERNGVATVLLHPSYSGLLTYSIHKPGSEIAKDKATIRDMPKGLVRSLATQDGHYVFYAGGPETDSQNVCCDLLKGAAELESLELELLQCKLGLLQGLWFEYCCQ